MLRIVFVGKAARVNAVAALCAGIDVESLWMPLCRCSFNLEPIYRLPSYPVQVLPTASFFWRWLPGRVIAAAGAAAHKRELLCKNTFPNIVHHLLVIGITTRQQSVSIQVSMDQDFWVRTCNASDRRSLSEQLQAVYSAGSVSVSGAL
jgi:hypothetical protein